MSFEIQLENFSLFYEQQCLFQNLHLTILANTCTCLLGPSGVGKSSLLNAIAGIIQDPQTRFSGCIKTADHQSLDGRVMLMSQQDGLLPWCDVIENVLIGYRLRGTIDPKAISQAKELLSRVGIQKENWHKKPKALSGGMRQRAALARTLIENKPVWLMDEPFSSLDAVTRYQMQELIVNFWQGKTVLLVTHDPLEALRLANQIYVMSGSPANLTKVEMPQTKAPRTLTPELLTIQANILELLAE